MGFQPEICMGVGKSKGRTSRIWSGGWFKFWRPIVCLFANLTVRTIQSRGSEVLGLMDVGEGKVGTYLL
jgi:hypothetical protein